MWIIKLFDGMEVMLNYFLLFIYFEKFKGEYREVNLKGEVYFEVMKNRKYFFIVQIELVNVEVLGIYFNVEFYLDDLEVKIMLFEGFVVVSNKSNFVCIVLKLNESVIYNKEKKSMIFEVLDCVVEEIVWWNGELIFINFFLQEIVCQLFNIFGVDIFIIDIVLQNYWIMVWFFSEEGFDQIFDLLYIVGNFNYLYNNKEIMIIIKFNQI